MPLPLDLSSLKQAISQLEEALEIYDSELTMAEPRLKRHMRAAVIQAFEFTYELSFKMIKRYLELASANPVEVDDMSFNDVIREASKQSLVQAELVVWREYRRNRGTTSHTYDEQKAQEVLNSAPDFLAESRYLLIQLEKKNQTLG